jgi:hypothetical protein
VPSTTMILADVSSSNISEAYTSPRLIICKMQNSRRPFRICTCVFSKFILFSSVNGKPYRFKYTGEVLCMAKY